MSEHVEFIIQVSAYVSMRWFSQHAARKPAHADVCRYLNTSIWRSWVPTELRQVRSVHLDVRYAKYMHMA